MKRPPKSRNWSTQLARRRAASWNALGAHSHPLRHPRPLLPIAAALAALLALAALATESAHAQTFQVIHNFSGAQDGATPQAGLTMDRAGNLYGTANYGGNAGGDCGVAGCGSVFRLTKKNGNWVLSPLYDFAGGNDGSNPQSANVVINSDGSLFSSTFLGGQGCTGQGCGTVFKLQPPASVCKTAICLWNETVLHRFSGLDGIGPVGALVFDQSGNLDGVTNSGGLEQGGTVYQLNATGWQESVLAHPYGYPGSGVTLDHAGNLYGSTFVGGNNYGSVYRLVFTASGWVATNIYEFANGSDGAYPRAGVILDVEGNLYGATSVGGSRQGGTIFKLSPSGDSWTLTTLYSFPNPNNGQTVVGPIGSLAMDGAGNLYGTTVVDGAQGYGAVFKLTPSDGGWAYTSLHDFTNGDDGAFPYSNLVFDSAGNIYGTASGGGANGHGVVFEITP
ncbi:MAG: choice-of-anchor tandem repeat GloVer-containing protein [Candidatus Korobacteraceae bacterium]